MSMGVQPADVADGGQKRFAFYVYGILAVSSLAVTMLVSLPMLLDEDDTGWAGIFGTGALLWGGVWTLLWSMFALATGLRLLRRARALAPGLAASAI